MLWLLYTRLDFHLLTWHSGFCLKQNPRLVISISCAFMVVSTQGESMLPHRSPLWCRFFRLNQDSRSQMMCKMCARSCSHVLRIIQDVSWTCVQPCPATTLCWAMSCRVEPHPSGPCRTSCCSLLPFHRPHYFWGIDVLTKSQHAVCQWRIVDHRLSKWFDDTSAKTQCYWTRGVCREVPADEAGVAKGVEQTVCDYYKAFGGP